MTLLNLINAWGGIPAARPSHLPNWRELRRAGPPDNFLRHLLQQVAVLFQDMVGHAVFHPIRPIEPPAGIYVIPLGVLQNKPVHVAPQPLIVGFHLSFKHGNHAVADLFGDAFDAVLFAYFSLSDVNPAHLTAVPGARERVSPHRQPAVVIQVQRQNDGVLTHVFFPLSGSHLLGPVRRTRYFFGQVKPEVIRVAVIVPVAEVVPAVPAHHRPQVVPVTGAFGIFVDVNFQHNIFVFYFAYFIHKIQGRPPAARPNHLLVFGD
ncbi:hypothetical membrane protein [Pelotomaculum thermopropionicum SI]|uniref:Hypothetical membrane protein n=1 Tax=Pelotomaculum thermopropionicum (strain DSM 13744 / JCM 10971 / SI) TaxID=370438 RepID=A5CZE7_PELTS|nr:hypothetical membrane protein [Pelotomaculum thermopropionicum SI]